MTELESPPVPACEQQAVIRQSVSVSEKTGRVSVRWNEFLSILWMGDILVNLAALGATLYLREVWTIQDTHYAVWCCLLSALWTSAGFSLNSYEHHIVFSATRSILNATKCTILTWLVFQSIPYLSPNLPIRRAEILLPIVLCWPMIAVWRYIAAVLAARPQLGHRILLVGNPVAAKHLVSVLHASLARHNSGLYQTIGLVGLAQNNEANNELDIQGLPLLGAYPDLADLCEQTQPDEIVLTEGLSEIKPELLDVLLVCHEKGIQVSAASDLVETISGKIPLRYAEGDLRAVLPFLRPPGYRLFILSKRIADVLVALVGLAMTAILVPGIAVINLIWNPGPLLFSQVRTGKGGRAFRLYKFRSMIVNAEAATGPVMATKNDSRIPFWGSILRKSRIDELPQFWNILRGDMSLIGPRPERPEFVSSFTEKLPFYRARHSVRPGITGWAQVRYPYGENFEDTVQKLQYDLYYVKHQSFYLDYLVFLQTFQVVLGLRGQ